MARPPVVIMTPPPSVRAAMQIHDGGATTISAVEWKGTARAVASDEYHGKVDNNDCNITATFMTTRYPRGTAFRLTNRRRRSPASHPFIVVYLSWKGPGEIPRDESFKSLLLRRVSLSVGPPLHRRSPGNVK